MFPYRKGGGDMRKRRLTALPVLLLILTGTVFVNSPAAL